MKIIILEGIATSGKTSVKNKLVNLFISKGNSFSVVEEDETLIPILANKDPQISLDFLKKVIATTLKSKKDFLVFDRLFFTHIYRTHSNIDFFRELEDILRPNSFLVFLKIDESKIPERIEKARSLRDQKWNEYVSKKGSDAEIYQYYIEQQKKLLALLQKTTLRYKTYDTTAMNFENIAENILSDCL